MVFKLFSQCIPVSRGGRASVSSLMRRTAPRTKIHILAPSGIWVFSILANTGVDRTNRGFNFHKTRFSGVGCGTRSSFIFPIFVVSCHSGRTNWRTPGPTIVLTRAVGRSASRTGWRFSSMCPGIRRIVQFS